MDIPELAKNLAVNNGISSSNSEINDISYSTNKDDDFQCFMSPIGTRQWTSTSNVRKKDRNLSSKNDRLISKAMLEPVLKSQESLEIKIDRPTECSSSSSSDGKRKRIVPWALSVSQ